MSKIDCYNRGYMAGAVKQAVYRKQGNGYADPEAYKRGFLKAQRDLFGESFEEKVVPLTGDGGPVVGTATVSSQGPTVTSIEITDEMAQAINGTTPRRSIEVEHPSPNPKGTS